MREDLSQKILQTIEKKHMKPKPKWRFLLKNWLWWILGIITICIGALAFAITVFIIKNNDWDFYAYTHMNLVKFVFLTLPYLWVLAIIALIGLAQYQIKHTQHGYRYPLKYLIGIIVVASVVSGFFFYQFGFAQTIDETFVDQLPLYREMMHRRELRWDHPEEGRLAGIVHETKPGELLLEDFSGKTWHVFYTQKTLLPPLFEIEVSDRLRILGKQQGENQFYAERLGPWLLREKRLQFLKRFLFERKSQGERSN